MLSHRGLAVLVLVSIAAAATADATAQDAIQEVLRSTTAENTTKRMLDLYGTASDGDKMQIESVTYAMYHGIFWSNVDVFARMKQKIYCIPEKMALSPKGVMSIVQNYAKSNPKVLGASYGLTILLALRDRFPCAAKGA